VPAPRGKRPTWGGYLPQFLGRELCQSILGIVTSEEEYLYHHASAAEALCTYREELGHKLQPHSGGLVFDDDGASLWVLGQAPPASDPPTRSSVIIGAVRCIENDVARGVCTALLRCEGFEVHDFGAGAEPDAFVKAVIEHQAGIVWLMAEDAYDAPRLSSTINALQAAGLRDQVRITIVGAAATQALADEVGADVFAHDATDGARLL
jgi:methylmalonyl-CoA mutase cobalamin-binding subunit